MQIVVNKLHLELHINVDTSHQDYFYLNYLRDQIQENSLLLELYHQLHLEQCMHIKDQSSHLFNFIASLTFLVVLKFLKVTKSLNATSYFLKI